MEGFESVYRDSSGNSRKFPASMPPSDVKAMIAKIEGDLKDGARLIGTVIVTEKGRTDQDIFHECSVFHREDGGLEVIRAADDATLAMYAPGGWSGVRIDDGRTVVPADDGEDDES